eukprot:1686032-Pyramimonas_sp.AAC.1
MGLAPTTLRQLRAQVPPMCGSKWAGDCATTAIRISRGKTSDPLSGGPMELLSSWQEHLLRMAQWRDGINLARQESWQKLQGVENRWQHVRGHLAAVQATLLEMNWTPNSQGEWTMPSGGGIQLRRSRRTIPFKV